MNRRISNDISRNEEDSVENNFSNSNLHHVEECDSDNIRHMENIYSHKRKNDQIELNAKRKKSNIDICDTTEIADPNEITLIEPCESSDIFNGFCSDENTDKVVEKVKRVYIRKDNFDFNHCLYKELGIINNISLQNKLSASELIASNIGTDDLSDNEEHFLNITKALKEKELQSNHTLSIRNMDSIKQNRQYTLLENINTFLIYSYDYKESIIKNSSEIRKLSNDMPTIKQKLHSLGEKKKEIYSIVWKNTLYLASQLGKNIVADRVQRFNLNDHQLDESDIDYLRRAIGGYKYHFYKYGSDVKGYYSFNKVFTVAFHIFHSPIQYDETLNCSFEDYIKQLAKEKEETQKQQELRYKIEKKLFSNLYENSTFNEEANIAASSNNLFREEIDDATDIISRNRQMLVDLENGYNFDVIDRDPIENVYYKIGCLAKLCDNNCDLITLDFIEEIFTIIIAFQDKNNKMQTLFAILKYIRDRNFMDKLEKYMICYSRLRGFHRRLGEIISQLTWISKINRFYNDSTLNDFSKFNISLRRQLCVKSITYTSNEIDFSVNIETIERLRESFKKIDFQICSLCERLLFEQDMTLLTEGGVVSGRLKKFIPLSEVDGIKVHSLKEHIGRNNNNFQNSMDDYVCSQCYKFNLIEKNRNTPPKASLYNNLYFDIKPNELKNLNYIEKLLISKTWCVQNIISITEVIGTHTKIKAVKGYAICFNIDNIKSFAEMLKPGTRQIIVQNKTNVGLTYSNVVDVMKVYSALKWLKNNNPYYKDDVLPDINNENQKDWIHNNIKNQLIFYNSGFDGSGCEILEYKSYISNQDYMPYIFEDGVTSGVKGDVKALFDLKYANGNIGRLTDDRSIVTAFPWIYPYGRFSPYYHRPSKITTAYYLKCISRRADRKVVKDPQFIFALEKTEQEAEGRRNIQTSLKYEGGKNFLANDLGFFANKGKLLSAFTTNRLSDAYWKKITNKLIVIETFIGPATWFMTLNPAAKDWPEVTDLYKKYHDAEFGNKFNLEEEIAKDPFIFNMFFQKKVKLLLKELIENPLILGRVVYYYYKTEYQQRGPPHCHFLLWTEDGMKLDINNDKEVKEFLDKYVTCSIYKNHEELHNIVKKYQVHKCLSMYCLKKKLKPIPEHKLKQPAKDLKLRDKTYKIVKCRFGYPKKHRSETTIFRMDPSLEAVMEICKRPHKAYELQRDLGEENINPYNPTIAMIFQSNTDLTFNALQITPTGAINYAAKYVSKTTLSCNEEVNNLMKDLAYSKNKNITSILFKLAYSLHLRPQPFTEIMDAAIGNKTHDTSINVYYCSTENKENRVRITKALKDMEGECIGLTTKENIYDNYYINRPKVLEDSCLFQILANFTCRNINEKNKIRNTNINFNESFDSQSDIIQTEDEKESRNIYYFITKNTNKRHISSPCFQHSSKIDYPIYNYQTYLFPVKIKLLNFFNGLKIIDTDMENDDEEDVYRRYCLLFVPYRSETYSESSKERFLNYINRLKQNHPRSAKDIEILINCANNYLKKQILQNDFREYKKQSEERIRHLLREEGENIDEIGAYEDDDIDLLKNVKSVNHLLRNVDSLNDKQKQIFDKVKNCVINEIKYGSDERCRLLVDGPGGSGKSYLIKVLSEYITYLCRSNLNEFEQTYPNVLICGPTGMSANQISGKTAHSLFGIPCNANFTYIRYSQLSSGKLTKLSERLKHVKLLIIDEISMIPNDLLYMINLRINEAKHSDIRLFGNLNVLLFGDMMQLPPVSNMANRPMFYKEIEINKFNKIFSGTFSLRSAFIDFKIISLTENVRQANDPRFGKILNSIRFGNCSDDARSLLDERRTVKTLFETYMECMNKFEDCVIISPNNKTINETNTFIIKSIAEHNEIPCYKISCKENLKVVKSSEKRIYMKKEARYSHNPIIDITLSELQSTLKVFAKKTNREENGLSKDLYICEKSRVMLTRNKNVRMGLCNGARGYVVAFKTVKETGTATNISVLDVDNIIVKFDNCEEPVPIKPCRYAYVQGKTLIQRIQFPLQVCYSMTVHKCQGLTLPSAIINFPTGPLNKINETPGLLYVALSRVKTSDTLFIYDLDIDKYNNANMENKEQIEKMSGIQENLNIEKQGNEQDEEQANEEDEEQYEDYEERDMADEYYDRYLH
uniref:ATP-dependent DNA helicase n=1 Tax=Strongyloides papillosus TaxID=174720 RepID=A0A0N5CBD9_STREA